MKQLNVFVDQIFQSPEFRQPQFQKYLFYALLTDGNTIRIVSDYMRANSTSNKTKAQLIQDALTKKMADLQTPAIQTVKPVGGKRRSKKSKRTRKHHRKNNKSRKISKKRGTQNK